MYGGHRTGGYDKSSYFHEDCVHRITVRTLTLYLFCTTLMFIFNWLHFITCPYLINHFLPIIYVHLSFLKKELQKKIKYISVTNFCTPCFINLVCVIR